LRGGSFLSGSTNLACGTGYDRYRNDEHGYVGFRCCSG
jgi:hypothetical protein